jgi:NTE family protein
MTGLADRQIALALSGGGTRAMAFHAGVIRYLAEVELLHNVKHISSVSGGSLLMGLILNSSGWKWPSAVEYRTAALSYIRQTLTENDLVHHAVQRLIQPENWRYMLSRANIIADAIEHLWSIDARLADLPDDPVWSVNATTSETGRRFRFKQTAVGDYELGYANAAEFKVAHAMAVSAAYPGVIGPFVIEASRYKWRKRDNWDLPKEAEQTIAPPFGNLHLYDGGIYDNLGTEPLFDSGKQCAKEGTDFIIVSDAGAPLGQIGPAWFRPFRLKRVADIIGEQTRALRVRSFVNFLQNQPGGGAYIQIGAQAEEKLRAYGQQNPAAAELLLLDRWVSANDLARVARYRTTLRRMDKADFDLIAQHGYETAKWNLRLFSSTTPRGGAGVANGAMARPHGVR